MIDYNTNKDAILDVEVTSAARVAEPPTGFILNYNKSVDGGETGERKKIYLVLTNGKKSFVVDNNKKRLWRVRQKIGLFAEQHKDLKKTQWIHVTLTYDMSNYEWSPKDISKYVNNMAHRQSVLAYAWIAEVQENHHIHYHVMFLTRKGYRLPMPDKGGQWKKGMSSIKLVAGPFYLMKYLTKAAQKEFQYLPKGARCVGVWSRYDGFMDKIRHGMASYREKGWIDMLGFKEGKKACLEAKKGVLETFGGGFWLEKITDDLQYANSLAKLWAS